MGKFRCSRISSLVRGLLPKPGSSRIVRNDGSDLLSHRDISIKLLSLSRRDISIELLSYNIFVNVFLSKFNQFFRRKGWIVNRRFRSVDTMLMCGGEQNCSI